MDDAIYSPSSDGVTIDLSIKEDGYSTGSGGDAEGDRLRSIEANILGSNHDDVLTGDEKGNRFVGLAGDDILTGGAGADILLGGEGNDILTGGAGADILLGGAGDDTLGPAVPDRTR